MGWGGSLQPGFLEIKKKKIQGEISLLGYCAWYTRERKKDTGSLCIIVLDLITKSGDSIGPAVDLVATPPAQPLLLRSVSSSIHPCFGSPVALQRPSSIYVLRFIRVYGGWCARDGGASGRGGSARVIRRKLHIIMTCY